jgi:hypothetical protein
MMGDNRDNGFDSRYFGPVPRKQIVGRATAVALSFDRENSWLTFLHWGMRGRAGFICANPSNLVPCVGWSGAGRWLFLETT